MPMIHACVPLPFQTNPPCSHENVLVLPGGQDEASLPSHLLPGGDSTGRRHRKGQGHLEAEITFHLHLGASDSREKHKEVEGCRRPEDYGTSCHGNQRARERI